LLEFSCVLIDIKLAITRKDAQWRTAPAPVAARQRSHRSRDDAALVVTDNKQCVTLSQRDFQQLSLIAFLAKCCIVLGNYRDEGENQAKTVPLLCLENIGATKRKTSLGGLVLKIHQVSKHLIQ
jgi:hypothetical protein